MFAQDKSINEIKEQAKKSVIQETKTLKLGAS